MTRLRQIVQSLKSAPAPPTVSVDSVDLAALINGCELLLAQYEALDDFTLVGALTNAPFIKIREALGK